MLKMQERYLQAIRNGNTSYFYKSKTWQKKRKQILLRDHNECQMCKSKGKVSIADHVHHIKHLTARPDLGLDDDNLIGLCAACHNYEHPEKLWQPDIKKYITEEKW
ncbi:HNH endonuclease [Tindallia californiensis]|uniref:Putative HNH nuclease YajD n=1 Tax=Tindallia californiensis TaxID=159292 RepID=A0A1H3R2D2_9FIRM|nr:HNH endonuclease signature motif containing protein [Tindallia californiensis]SDZ19109.1 HNH endonuclease [Tindallia californiensis]